MFLLLSKLLDVLLSPLAWALLLGALALLLARRRPRGSRTLALGALALLYLFSVQPVSNALMYLTESGARSSYRPQHTYDAVIVLGGALEPGATRASGEVQLNAAAERVEKGFELLQGGHARQALLSGGAIDPGQPLEAEAMARLLTRWGISPSRLVLEAKSRNTRENALEAARVVQRERWGSLLLVTSAAHLPRAVGCFRAVGLQPDTLAVDVRAVPPTWGGLLTSSLPRAAHLNESELALRELAGRAVYRLRGYSAP
ncbi:YdcF family protein [Aggregicoccus sp. 17bor-14]|uniref:YdcF family protein n=1 Tax=Myxococcaceae TaxID=31 RepID=UPI00129D0092|nr:MULTISPECIES: YdcF family protein [Myxococcaceae]MBF5046554.1 YdcF family protein [Simulacricoccus sp. 17bor-14]MRI92265.1 YdcF family protein [Aggregicoccus sp. 17bor-14]